MPMPVSATESSIQSRLLPTLLACSLTSPSFVNLHALLSRLSRICRRRMRVDRQSAEVLLRLDNQAVLVLVGELSRGADDLIRSAEQVPPSEH